MYRPLALGLARLEVDASEFGLAAVGCDGFELLSIVQARSAALLLTACTFYRIAHFHLSMMVFSERPILSAWKQRRCIDSF